MGAILGESREARRQLAFTVLISKLCSKVLNPTKSYASPSLSPFTFTFTFTYVSRVVIEAVTDFCEQFLMNFETTGY